MKLFGILKIFFVIAVLTTAGNVSAQHLDASPDISPDVPGIILEDEAGDVPEPDSPDLELEKQLSDFDRELKELKEQLEQSQRR